MKIPSLLILLCFSAIAVAQDSLFFYRSGDIIYRNSTNAIDSVSFLPPDYYAKYRSNIVFSYLSQETTLTKFAQMVQIAGYEKELDNKTIWVPVNSALSQINLSDTTLVKQIVNNHISPNIIYPNADGSNLTVNMTNNKRYILQKTNENLTLDGKIILTINNLVARSVIHTLNDYVPYKLNLWEYITQGTGHDLLKIYVNSKNILNGDKIIGNNILSQLSFLKDENSISSAIIPSDEAWTDAYNKLYPYCASYAGVTSNAQDEVTKLAIIHNNFYTAKLNPSRNDTSYLSTSGYQLKTPSSILAGAETSELSNGTVVNVNQLKMYNPEFWNKEIRVEAENMGFGITTANYSPTTLLSTDNVFDISDGKYLSLTPTSTSNLTNTNNTYVKFKIPNTFSMKYNIYCVFVPTAIVDTTNKKPYKVKFNFSYQNETGSLVYDNFVTATNTLTTTSSQTGVFTTNPTTITKMLVLKDFLLPYCNLILSSQNSINVVLKVANAASITEDINYNRNIRIDCIIFEPFQ